MNKSKAVERNLREAAKKLNCKADDIWEDICAGYADNIPDKKGIIEDIDDYVKAREKIN